MVVVRAVLTAPCNRRPAVSATRVELGGLGSGSASRTEVVRGRRAGCSCDGSMRSTRAAQAGSQPPVVRPGQAYERGHKEAADQRGVDEDACAETGGEDLTSVCGAVDIARNDRTRLTSGEGGRPDCARGDKRDACERAVETCLTCRAGLQSRRACVAPFVRGCPVNPCSPCRAVRECAVTVPFRCRGPGGCRPICLADPGPRAWLPLPQRDFHS